MADEGIEHTILAPWQVEGGPLIDTRRPVRLELGDGRSIVAVLYDGLLSAAVSFEPDATVDADAFVRDRLVPRMSQSMVDGAPPLVVIASDGELYGHHQPFRERFLARLVGRDAPPDLPFGTPSLGEAIAAAEAGGLPSTALMERTSWSCEHGIARWSTDCGCVADGSWKGPLRSALDRLAGGIDGATDHLVRALPGAPDPWAARDAYVDVVIGARSEDEFVGAHLGGSPSSDDRSAFARLMEAQRWRLAMFASDGWFWDDPFRIETRQNLRCAARAVRIVDGLTGSRLESGLLADLALFRSVETGLDGAEIYRLALEDVGQTGQR
jgi:hypothetical protein